MKTTLSMDRAFWGNEMALEFGINKVIQNEGGDPLLLLLGFVENIFVETVVNSISQ